MIIRVLVTFLILSISTTLLAQNDLQQMMLDQINAERRKRLRPAVGYKIESQESCNAWAKSVSKSFRHSAYGRAETIAMTLTDTTIIIPQFMASSGHKKALMDIKAKKVCIAVYEVPGYTSVKHTKNGAVKTMMPPRYYTVIRTYGKND